jgi:histidine ammonia-lyase
MILIGQSKLTLKDFSEIVFNNQEVELDAAAIKNVEDNFKFLQSFSSNKLIYGINTGFGPMAQYKVSEENLLQLQYNLIRSHSSGSGALLSPVFTKALMIARLNSLIQGYSGVHPDIINLLKQLINNDVTPVVFEHGGVGASGDLVQLAHLGLVLIGEGEVMYEGQLQATADVFNKLNITPLNIRVREGLATINGTSAMTGIGMVNIAQAQKLLNWSVMLSAMTNEVAKIKSQQRSAIFCKAAK